MDTAYGLARVLPILGLAMTESLPEALRDSRSQMILLQILEQRQTATVSEVAEAMGVAVPTASTMVRKMAEKGLLDRTTDPNDGRSVLLSLSPVGRQVFRETTERRTQSMARLLDNLTEPDLHILSEAIPVLERLVSQADGSHTP